MKADIHPEYKDATVSCACGSVIQTRSTRGSFTIDVCSACHPFFTGKQRIMDTAGRVERFRKKYEGVTPAAPKAPKAPRKKKGEAAEA